MLCLIIISIIGRSTVKGRPFSRTDTFVSCHSPDISSSVSAPSSVLLSRLAGTTTGAGANTGATIGAAVEDGGFKMLFKKLPACSKAFGAGATFATAAGAEFDHP